MDVVVSVIEKVVTIGNIISEHLSAYEEAAESIEALKCVLDQLKDVVSKLVNSDVDKSHIFSIIFVLEKTEKTLQECIKSIEIKEKRKVKKLFKQTLAVFKAPSTLKNIQDIIIKIKTSLDITSKSLSITKHAQASSTTIISTSTASVTTSDNGLKSELREALANTVDELVTRLKKDCQQLQEKLDRSILNNDPFFLEILENDNPEAISFWKDHFMSAELSISSTAPYENMYVSWARFVHELEITFQLKNIPTATKEAYFGDIDLIRKHGNRHYIDPTGTRNLRDIRPLWLPALRQALDPLHKGYIKPDDYLSFLDGMSLSNRLKQIVLNSCGYGIFVECQRTSADIAFPSEIESPEHSVGWMSACQIVSVPSPAELGIFVYDNVEPHISNLIESITYPQNDIWVYVRYLQTGQIERKLLSKDVRMPDGLRVGITITIHTEKGWSNNLLITELKACAGGRYIVNAGSKDDSIVFVTKTPIGFDDHRIRIELNDLIDLPELDYSILGPSTVFTREPKVGEKIQIKAEELWYDSKVTAVNGTEVEYDDWFPAFDNIEDEDDVIGFSEGQFGEAAKGKSKVWCPWKNDKSTWDIRPYRCLHVGDLVEAPVVYPDYLYHYHGLEESVLYLPARIIDVQSDQYLVEFSPAVIAYRWWPGRSPKRSEFPRKPNSKKTVKNLFDGTQVMISMDRVRPYTAGPQPVLGTQSIRPQSWSAFQGVQFTDLEQLDEEIWK